MIFNVALLQINAHGFDQTANLEKGIAYCRKAKAQGADAVLFPEMWQIGYRAYHPRVFAADYNPLAPDEIREQHRWQQYAIDRDDPFIQSFQQLARELHLAIAITYLEKHLPKPRNALALIDPQGDIILHYAKVHLCEFSLEAACSAGDRFEVATLKLAQGEVKVGAMICFDREFPESARTLARKGAEIILVPNCCELEQHRRAQIDSRAFENMVGIAVCNYPPPEANGRSLAVSGIAFDENGQSANQVIVEARDKEGIYMADFDLNKLRAYRDQEVWGLKFANPESYAR